MHLLFMKKHKNAFVTFCKAFNAERWIWKSYSSIFSYATSCIISLTSLLKNILKMRFLNDFWYLQISCSATMSDL